MTKVDLSYFDINIPCLAACPVHTNAGAYVAAIADGDDRVAYLTARLPNPFASVCGRVCAAPCEDACRRGGIDHPIAIRALKRFVTETHGVEARSGSLWREVDGAGPERNQSVAVVGGGPGGLAAAHDLRLLGYQVCLYEASGELGGMMRLGIPEYRLPRELLDREIQGIVDLGVEVHLDTSLGTDVMLEDLRADHDAVFLAIGATRGRDLDIPGHDSDGVFKALEFLLNVNRGFHVDVGERVVVIGGGNVAMDAARTALRSAAYQDRSRPDSLEDTPDDHQSGYPIDVARSALRAGATSVTVVSLEARDEMPADSFEIDEAELEGIRFVHRRGPHAVLTDDSGKATSVLTVGVTRVFDQDGRFSPEFDREDIEVFDADSVILAIGQAVDLESLGADGPVISPRRTISVDQETLETSLPFVWAGGDAAFGPRILIDAVADGRRAAAGIHAALSPDDQAAAVPTGTMKVVEGFHRQMDRYDEWDRLPVPSLPSHRRIGLQEVETGFTAEEARLEASRCLRCFLNILLDVGSCVLCGLCADVCPVDAISLVPSQRVDGDPGSTVLLLDESHCIRCALCVDRCPSKALSMGMWSGLGVHEETPVLIGGGS